MQRFLYITNSVEEHAYGGREQLTRLMRAAMAAILGDRVQVMELGGSSRPGLLERLNGHVDGASSQSIAAVLDMIDHAQVGHVFINGSNLGKVASAIRNKYPQVQITTFFHNCEARFFLGAARRALTLHALGVLLANYVAERAAVRSSDIRIALNERDSDVLQKVYGRSATHLLPMAVADLLPASVVVVERPLPEPYILFVGGSFYANLAGFSWFAEQVAPSLQVKTVAVGKGLAACKEQLERHRNVHIIGAVDDLAPWYAGALCAIAPIFDGSGMKTKVAEAMMFGKRMVGTPEAFAGYEGVAAQVGSICHTAEDFVAALSAVSREARTDFDPHLRALYERDFSEAALQARLRAIIGA